MENSNLDNFEKQEEQQKKTRGRKKKQIENKTEIKNDEKTDIEILQIEQVKKKRGRKKKMGSRNYYQIN